MPLVRLNDDELDQLHRYRREKRLERGARRRATDNPAIGASLTIQELPFWRRSSAPAGFTALMQVKNALQAVLFGLPGIEGGVQRLTPAEIAVLLLLVGVKLRLLRIRGYPDPENLAGILNYSARAMRDAIRNLYEYGLIGEPERELGRIVKIELAAEIMAVANRPRAIRQHETCPPGRRRYELDVARRQNSARVLSERSELSETPVCPRTPAPAAAPPDLPQTPTTAGKGNAPPGPTAAPAPLVEVYEAELVEPRHDQRHKRPRQQGPNDYSRDRRSRGMLRSLLELVGFAGPAPPS